MAVLERKWVQTGVDKNIILPYLRRYRSLFSYVSDCPDRLLRDITSALPTRYMIFPCDIIDLRSFFLKNKISFPNPIILFSLKLAEKYLKDYSIFLILDSKKIDVQNCRYGGIQINFADELNITNLLLRVIVNEPAASDSFDAVKLLVEEFGVSAECLVSNSIPALSSPTPKLSINKNSFFKSGQFASEIQLNDREAKIFDFLRLVKRENNLNIQMRVAGGWVRDKLLGKESDDIDIAVDMPGYDFAQIVASSAAKHGVTRDPKAYKVSLEKSADPSEKEPDDKLMVGAVNIFGQKIEFVPMRTEHYPDPNSRQPEITTTNDPREDVKRRDLTINAIYFNIDTGQIDDFVGGRKDLGIDGTMVLRTPDDPFKTFHEDPLRLLRVLRFHSRYPNSMVDPSITEAMKHPEIQESYLKKVATERAGPEIMKMMMGENPVDSLRMLFDSGLYKQVFKVPLMEDINPAGIHMDQRTPHHKYDLLHHILEVINNMNQIMKDNNEDDYMRGLMNLAAMFHDFGKMGKDIQTPHPENTEQMQYLGHERLSTKMANQILKSIGVGKEDRDIVNQVIRLHMRPLSAEKWSKRGRGRFLRDTRLHGKEDIHKDLWKYVLYHAQADDMASQPGKYDAGKHQQIFQDLSDFVTSPSGSFRGTVVNGLDVIKNFPDLDRKTGYIVEVLNRIRELQDTGKIDMSFVTMPEGAEKETALEYARQQAFEAMQAMSQEIINKYKGPNMAKNWFKKIKVSQTVLDGTATQVDPEIVKGPKEALPNYEEGIKVRDRRRGMANPQEYGKVDKIDGNKIRIVWNPEDKKRKVEEIFDMVEDTEVLSLIVAEV